MASDTSTAATTKPHTIADESTVIAILGALSLSHLLNDVMQSLLPAVYPLLKQNYALSFFQIGLITFAFHVTASLLQPLVGLYTDRRPWAYSLLLSTLFTLHGPRVARGGGQLRSDPGGGLDGRHRLLDLSSRSIARGPTGLRRSLRLCPIAVPGRRQHGLGDRPAARGVYRDAARPDEPRLVLDRRRSSPAACCCSSAAGTNATSPTAAPIPGQRTTHLASHLSPRESAARSPSCSRSCFPSTSTW